MSEPIIADNSPKAVDVKAGEEYHWCACGQSKNQPFCDGSHIGTEFTPVAFTPDADGEAYLCACKHTGNAPNCDGTRTQFTADQVGTDGTDGTGGDPAETPVALGDSDSPVARATPEEPTVAFIHELARDGLSKVGHHGPMTSMGVPRKDLPHWDDLQIMAAQMATKPLLDDVDVATELIIGPEADKPLRLEIPLFVSDMSFGALSEEAKVSLAKGAELAGTGICSGEGGMLPEEQAANSRYFYELASAKFGYHDGWSSSRFVRWLCPMSANSLSMPAEHGVGFDDQKRVASTCPLHCRPKNPQDRPVDVSELWSVDLTSQDQELMTESEDRCVTGVACGEYPSESVENKANQSREQGHERRRLPASPMPETR